MDYNRFDRFFVTLDGQDSDFAMRQTAGGSGHIKIETGEGRGAMRISVRNLRYFDNEYVYKLILFGVSEGKNIYAIIGTVNVSKIGNGETYFRFVPADLDGAGHELADFSYAVVAAVSTKNDEEPLRPVLKGELGICDEDKVCDAGEESSEEERICYNSYYNRYLLEICERISSETDVYDRIVPFSEDVTDAVWVKMGMDERIPVVSPGAEILRDRYRHYIFGKGEKDYFIGVPGRFLRDEQPEEGESGFTLWQPIIGAEELNAMSEEASLEARLQAYGYWIVAIRRENGDILEA
ncbi:MAG: hypothetical protein E7225_07745 [Clostridiales bacterium]|nr:hypothetical protein [Clostridiales bacterium]